MTLVGCCSLLPNINLTFIKRVNYLLQGCRRVIFFIQGKRGHRHVVVRPKHWIDNLIILCAAGEKGVRIKITYADADSV